MSEGKPKHVKTSTNRAPRQPRRVRNKGDGDPSSERLAKFVSRVPTYVRYAEMVQGAVRFLELIGNIYPSLVREFYANFQQKDGGSRNLVQGRLIVLNNELFMDVGGLASDGAPLGNCEDEKWSAYDSIEMYKSCLRAPHCYVPGELTKSGSLSFENKLLHELIAYMLVKCNTNHAQPTVNNLKLMFPIKEGILVNWPSKVLKVMSGITNFLKTTCLWDIHLPIIDHLGINTSDVEIIFVNSREHLVGDNLIHKMSIYKYGAEWMYQEDHNTTIDLDLSDEDENANQGEQNP
ncbi:hypothetical protein Lal_00015822 [Lupinus albus]|nr:hypothetical protein Lal_00015822 [Lupinus albus]